jgi:hypothetical protein
MSMMKLSRSGLLASLLVMNPPNRLNRKRKRKSPRKRQIRRKTMIRMKVNKRLSLLLKLKTHAQPSV